MKKLLVLLLPLVFVVGCGSVSNTSSSLPTYTPERNPNTNVTEVTNVKVEDNNFDFFDILEFLADLFTK